MEAVGATLRVMLLPLMAATDVPEGMTCVAPTNRGGVGGLKRAVKVKDSRATLERVTVRPAILGTNVP